MQNYNSESDHSIVILECHMKVKESEEKYIFTRKYEEIDFNKVNVNIKSNPKYNIILQSKDANFIATELINMINSELDKESLLKNIKIIEKYETRCSDAILKVIEKRTNSIKFSKKILTMKIKSPFKNLKVQVKIKRNVKLNQTTENNLPNVKIIQTWYGRLQNSKYGE